MQNLFEKYVICNPRLIFTCFFKKNVFVIWQCFPLFFWGGFAPPPTHPRPPHPRVAKASPKTGQKWGGPFYSRRWRLCKTCLENVLYMYTIIYIYIYTHAYMMPSCWLFNCSCSLPFYLRTWAPLPNEDRLQELLKTDKPIGEKSYQKAYKITNQNSCINTLFSLILFNQCLPPESLQNTTQKSLQNIPHQPPKHPKKYPQAPSKTPPHTHKTKKRLTKLKINVLSRSLGLICSITLMRPDVKLN